jgi:hypothetical protein
MGWQQFRIQTPKIQTCKLFIGHVPILAVVLSHLDAKKSACISRCVDDL